MNLAGQAGLQPQLTPVLPVGPGPRPTGRPLRPTRGAARTAGSNAPPTEHRLARQGRGHGSAGQGGLAEDYAGTKHQILTQLILLKRHCTHHLILHEQRCSEKVDTSSLINNTLISAKFDCIVLRTSFTCYGHQRRRSTRWRASKSEIKSAWISGPSRKGLTMTLWEKTIILPCNTT